MARHGPRPIARVFYRLPVYLYRVGLGWLLGKRFLLLEHTGRRSGRRYRTVVEVAGWLPETGTYLVASGYGPQADWYRNLKASPETTIQVGRRRFAVRARHLGTEESGQAMVEYARRHPAAARGLARLLGYQVSGDEGAYRQLGEAKFPFVAFEPRATGEN